MPQQSVPSTGDSSHRRPRGSRIEKKIRRLRDSRQAQKQLQQLVIIIAAVLIAFIIGFYLLGPSFSSPGE